MVSGLDVEGAAALLGALGSKSRKKHRVWSIGGRDAVYFRVDPTRGHKVAAQMLEGLDGVLVVDRYRACPTAARAAKGRFEVCIRDSFL